MSTLLQDLRFAVRSLLRHPLFTAVGLVTLALGIGLNTAVFSAIEALLLRPLGGVRAPNELVQVYRSLPGNEAYGMASLPHYRELRDRSRDVIADMGAWAFAPMSVSFGGKSARVMGAMTSASMFSTVDVQMERGRAFSSDEETGLNAHRVVIVGYEAWQREFGGDPSLVGKSIILSGRSYSVVGITGRDFAGLMPMIVPSLYVPLTQYPDIVAERGALDENWGESYLNIIARVKPGYTLEQAKARLATINAQLGEVHPDTYRNSSINLVRQSEAGIHPSFRQAQLQMSGLIMAVVAMLLLIACVNVANLFLARASERSREMAVRLSIGAERSRLIRQLLTESILFSVIAGAIGLLVAAWAISIANGVRIPMDVMLRPNLQLSIPVLSFSVALSVVVGMLFGLAPALQATRPQLVPMLKGESPAGQSRSRLSSALVVAQVALSLVLLNCAGLFLRNLSTAGAVDKGFATDHLLFASVDPMLQGYSRARGEQFFARLTERLRGLRGVTGVALANDVPLGLTNNDGRVEVAGYTPAPDENMSVGHSVVSVGYFETLRVPMVKGRTFTERDDSAAAPVAIVNQRFVERYLQGREPIGARVKVMGENRTIVGVTRTGKYSSLGEDPKTHLYVPHAQYWSSWMNLAIRTAGDPEQMISQLRTEVAALDADMPVSDVRTIEEHLGWALLPSRIAGTALGVFGILGLILAAVGVYGVMSYSVAQRTREIGIRMAIGSSERTVVRLVVSQGMRLVWIGTALGVAGALGASQLARGLLYGGSANDPTTIGVVTVVLASVALLAVWIPARRAARVDPIVALRAE